MVGRLDHHPDDRFGAGRPEQHPTRLAELRLRRSDGRDHALVRGDPVAVHLGSRWWVALIGLAGTVVGGLGTSGATALSAAVAVQGYSGLVVPPEVALVNWLVTGSLTVWLLGLLLLVTTALGGLTAALGASRRPRSR